MAHASLKVINLLLHVSGILVMRDVAFTPRLTLTGVGSMHTSLSVPLSFKITEVILTLRPRRLYLVWTKPTIVLCWIHYDTSNFSQMAPIVRTRFESLAQKVDGLRPKEPKTMNL